MPYQPIENYGIIGDMHTCALVGINGSIDWFCYPHFDSPSVFASILDDKIGGFFRIYTMEDKVTSKQLYWPETNVLITRFLSDGGVGEITDYMPVHSKNPSSGYHQLIRKVKVARGRITFKLECFPAFNFARDAHTVEIRPDGAVFKSKNLSLVISTNVKLSKTSKEGMSDGISSEFTLEEGEFITFILGESEGFNIPDRISEREEERLLDETINYWHKWLSNCTYKGRWREMVYRSALVLKLLTFEPTGAVLAAPTLGLPEAIDGERNWDYRYTWVRDAGFTLYGLIRVGFTQEAKRFMDFLERRCHELEEDGSLQPLYSIEGDHRITEEILSHLDGYMGSKPVRVGNAAYSQFQLDIYGALMDAVYLSNKYGNSISYDLWNYLTKLMNWLCDNADSEDTSIWEVRGGKRQFVYSKLMCWVALDRALRLAEKRSFPAPWEKWLKKRDDLYQQIMDRGWSKSLQSFTQSYDNDTLDASSLIMPLVFFMSPSDPRMLKTLAAINRPLNKGGLVSNGLVYRYKVDEADDGFSDDEGTFNMCSFWLVENLTRAGRENPKMLHEARLLFEQMLSYSNHLGLYAEETGFRGEALGNFPQSFTHLALISAAFNLDRALGEE